MSSNNTTLIVADPNKGIKVDAAIVAKPFRNGIKEKVAELKRQGIGMCVGAMYLELSQLLTLTNQMQSNETIQTPPY